MGDHWSAVFEQTDYGAFANFEKILTCANGTSGSIWTLATSDPKGVLRSAQRVGRHWEAMDRCGRDRVEQNELRSAASLSVLVAAFITGCSFFGRRFSATALLI
jgi:hypothetical protein